MLFGNPPINLMAYDGNAYLFILINDCLVPLVPLPDLNNVSLLSRGWDVDAEIWFHG